MGEEVWIRRHWSDDREAKVRLQDLRDFHWDVMSGGLEGGFGFVAPRPFVHARVWCDSFIEGSVAHSCAHGPGPHEIKVCIVKKSNRKLFPKIKVLPALEDARREITKRLYALRDHEKAKRVSHLTSDLLHPFFSGLCREKSERVASSGCPWLREDEVAAVSTQSVVISTDAEREAFTLGLRVAEVISGCSADPPTAVPTP